MKKKKFLIAMRSEYLSGLVPYDQIFGEMINCVPIDTASKLLYQIEI